MAGISFTELGQRAQQGVDERWNTGHRLPNGDLFRVELEFVTERDSVHHVVTVHSGNPRPDHMNWGTDTRSEVLAHEVGHLLGLEDEYREGDRNRQRAVYEDEGLMGPFARDGRGRPAVDNDHAAGVDWGRMRIAPRYLRQLGAWIEGALKTARLQTAHGVAFSTEDTLYPRADGLPTRAHFALDVRRSVLYGEARTGGGGRITPAPASDRPRPVALEGTDRPNGTYRATYPDLHRRPVRENLTDLIAGDLLLPAHPDPGPDPGLMMFPAHWTEEDAVYAAEQAYLHALRNGTVQTVPGRYGVHTWRGEYTGVWIEGEVRQGVFTGFCPSDDQADTLPPPHAAPPVPAADNHGGPVFGRRVEDLVRYGDRRTRTGAHHEPGLTPADQMRFHGLQINRGQEHHNKTYDAQVFFLHPGHRVGESRPFLPRAWEQHVDGDQHVMFPREWKPDTLLDNVEKAHGSALDAGTARQVDDRGTYHWVGTAAGVRIEGLVRDGRHLVFRPTYVQAHVSWPESRPVGEVRVPSVTVASDDGRVLPFDIRHLLFANGQRAVELTVRIHLAPAPGTDLAWMDETFDKVRRAIRGAIMSAANVSQMNGALVGLTLLRTDDVEQAHHTLLVVGRDERLMIGGIVGFVPNGAELRTFVEQLVYGWAPPADAWRLPADADQDDGFWALSHAVERLAFADPFGRPTTLREPDPSARGDWPSNVPSDAPSAPPADFGDLDEMEIFILSLDGFALAEEYSGPAVRLGARGAASAADGVDDGVDASRTSQTVPSAAPSMLSEGLSGPGRLLGSGEVRTDRFVPGSGEAFVVEAGEDGLPGRVLPGGSGGSGEWTEVGFVWEWFGGDRPGQETIRLTRRIFLDGQGVDAGRVEVMRRNAVAGLAELNAQGGRLPAVRPGGLVDGSDPSGPRLELVVEFVDSVADAHDVVQVRDGRPQVSGEMVQNVWYTQASPVLLAHEIAHGYGPRDTQAHDGGRALLASPRDEQGWPLGVPLTSHGDEAQQAGEGSWDLMGPIDLGVPGRSYGLTPHELGQIADILSPFLHHGVSAPKPRVVQETAYARPAAPIASDEGLGFEDGLGFDVDVESGTFGDFGVFPGDDGEAVGSRAWAAGSVDEDAEVLALAEEYSRPAGVDDVEERADSVPEGLNTASAGLTELLPDFGSQSVSAGGPADVDMEGVEEFAGSAGSVGLSSADDGVEASRTESAESGLVAGGGERLGGSESSVDEDDTDRSAQRGSKRRRIEVEAGTGGEGVRDEGADSDQEALNTAAAITELFGSDFGPQSVSAGGPADMGMGGLEQFAGLAEPVGPSSAVGGDASGAVGASDPGGAGGDARRELEKAVDGLRIKLGSLDALFQEIGAAPKDRQAIRNEKWDSVSSEVMDAIHEKREEYRDAPRFAVRVQVARGQVIWLQREKKKFSYIAKKVGATRQEVSSFRNHKRVLPVAVLKRIAGLYAAEGGLLDSQQYFPGGADIDVRRLEEAVDDLITKLGSLDALLREIEAPPEEKKAIREERWDLVSREVLDAIHEQRAKYRDAPRFAGGVEAARYQLEWLQDEKKRTFSYIASKVGADRKQVEDFSYGQYFLRAKVLMNIADLYGRERGLELPGQRLASQRSSSEEVPAWLSEFLDDVHMEGAEEFAGSDGSVGLSSAVGGEASGAVGASDPGGAGSDVRRLEEAVDDLITKLGSLDALFKEIGAESDEAKKAIREEGWDLVSREVLDAIHEQREEYRDAPRFAVRVQVVRYQLEWLQDEKERTFSYIANNVGVTRQELSDFRKEKRVLPFATLTQIADLYADEGGPEVQVQQLDSSGSDAGRVLEEIVDDLRIKMGSLDALFKEIGADPEEKLAIREEKWDSLSSEVLEAIHEQREKYRDAPRFAAGVKAARYQLEELQREKKFSYIAIAKAVGITANQVHKFRYGGQYLLAADLMNIAELYGREKLGEFLDEVRLDESEDQPAAGSADRVTAALLGFDVHVESGGSGDFGVFPGEAVGSRAWAAGSVDEGADVFALAEEYSGRAVRPGARDDASAADGADDGAEPP
ncbi:EndoU domain-containing protein [Streptomyces griseoflavus]|uniref:PE-PGRS family protein n=1 Tax=Streptomyces griseoflavus Tu4000 TaxID=467200 RepID=D9XZG7_9ACTN|nr:EndoU domain-containing protein [Streptomyces griseoflavus]EFL42799.1 PE-PGRS family protein [Streptomyces griseoflavus Tu4000]